MVSWVLSDGWRLVVACWSADLRVRMASRHRVVLGSVVCLSWALASARRRPLSAWTAYVQAGCLLVGVGRLLAPG
jgi:hypothetical protein